MRRQDMRHNQFSIVLLLALAMVPLSSARRVQRQAKGRSLELKELQVDFFADRDYRKRENGFPGSVFYEDGEALSEFRDYDWTRTNRDAGGNSHSDSDGDVEWRWRSRANSYSSDGSCKSGKGKGKGGSTNGTAKSSKSSKSGKGSQLPSSTPSGAPSQQPSLSQVPSGSPSKQPSSSPSVSLSPSGTPSLSLAPSGTPSSTPSLSLSPSSTPSVSAVPSGTPSGTPSGAPTLSMSPSLSSMPTMKSTKAPTLKSTKAPTIKSTKAPTIKSTKAPTIKSSRCEPTASPRPSASPAPTMTPRPSTSSQPSASLVPSSAPSLSTEPTLTPPSASPSISLEPSLSIAPSAGPSLSSVPSSAPSSAPSGAPSPNPSQRPTSSSDTSPGSKGSPGSISVDSLDTLTCIAIATRNAPDRDADGLFIIAIPVEFDDTLTATDVADLLYSKLRLPIALWVAGCEEEALGFLGRRLDDEDRFEYAEMVPWAAGESCTPSTDGATCNTFESGLEAFLIGDISDDVIKARIQRAFEIFQDLILSLSGILVFDVGEGSLEIDGPDDDTDALQGSDNAIEAEGLAAGTAVGIAAAGLAFILLLILLIRRQQESDEPSHLKLEDEGNEATFIREFETDPSSDGDSPYKTRNIHVVGEADSVISGWTGYTKDANLSFDDDAGVPGKLGHAHGDVHMCSSATCEVCELRRRGGVQFRPTGTPPRMHLPNDASREYLAEDTVEL